MLVRPMCLPEHVHSLSHPCDHPTCARRIDAWHRVRARLGLVSRLGHLYLLALHLRCGRPCHGYNKHAGLGPHGLHTNLHKNRTEYVVERTECETILSGFDKSERAFLTLTPAMKASLVECFDSCKDMDITQAFSEQKCICNGSCILYTGSLQGQEPSHCCQQNGGWVRFIFMTHLRDCSIPAGFSGFS